MIDLVCRGKTKNMQLPCDDVLHVRAITYVRRAKPGDGVNFRLSKGIGSSSSLRISLLEGVKREMKKLREVGRVQSSRRLLPRAGCPCQPSKALHWPNRIGIEGRLR